MVPQDRKYRIISDITPGRPVVRRPKVQRPNAPARRSYQPNRLVDVVYVPKHRPEALKVAESQHGHVETSSHTQRTSSVRRLVLPKSPWYLDFGRILPVGAAGLVLIVGLVVLVMTVTTNKRVVERVAAESQMVASDDGQAKDGSPPREDAVDKSAVHAYAVDPTLPRLLEIRSLNVQSRIRRMSTLRSGAVAVPANIYDTGWYEDSSKPGEGGAMLLVGHINGPSKPGVFAGIKDLKTGDVIDVLRGDGQKFQYKVIQKEQMPTEQVDMKKALIAVTPGKSGLNLMTCAGTATNGGTDYTDRIIVYTEQL